MKIKRCFNNNKKSFSLALALAGTFEIKAKVLISKVTFETSPSAHSVGPHGWICFTELGKVLCCVSWDPLAPCAVTHEVVSFVFHRQSCLCSDQAGDCPRGGISRLFTSPAGACNSAFQSSSSDPEGRFLHPWVV